MSSLLHRTSNHIPPLMVSGRGSWLNDNEGKKYLDACGGAAVSCIGHAHPRVIAAIRQQAEAVEYAHNSFFTCAPAEELADLLIARSPAPLTKIYLVSDGSEAVETAIKLARQYHVERGEPDRHLVISRKQSYHGNTLGALAIGGNAARRREYQPLLMRSEMVSACFAYHGQANDESANAYGARLAAELEAMIEREGAGNVMAFVAETVVGATAGAVAPVEGYFRRIREICDRHGILLILDEVMCGTGRTGTFHAFEQERIVPDILTNAKGLGGGYMPIGAVYLSAAIDDAIRLGSGAFKHGHTYNGHALACAAALEVQRVLEDEGMLAGVSAKGKNLAHLLQDRLGQHANVGDIRGRGLFYAIELVTDRANKTAFEPRLGLSARIKSEAMLLGLCVYPGSGTIDGVRGDHVLLAPPFNITDADLEQAVDLLAKATDAALSSIQA